MRSFGFPARRGLYDPRFEKESCGVGFVAHIKGARSRYIRGGGKLTPAPTEIGSTPTAGATDSASLPRSS